MIDMFSNAIIELQEREINQIHQKSIDNLIGRTPGRISRFNHMDQQFTERESFYENCIISH